MVVFIPGLASAPEIMHAVRDAAKVRRIGMRLTQRDLAERSGVPFGTIQKFEQTGKISFEALINIAMALDCQQILAELFPPVEALSLDDLPSTGQAPKRHRPSSKHSEDR